ncbi:hypothetical protein FRC04_009495 [Tulasnella sp. 424]|nr:hypothetical protein FRC04_009495 [Tulasnella sp. 424]KAG8971216.1 hypothetical protein FRC05_011410 [Tulasnella sp. 425]
MARSPRRNNTTYLIFFIVTCFSYLYFLGDSDDAETHNYQPNLDPVLLGFPDPSTEALNDSGEHGAMNPSGIPWSGVVPVSILPKVTDQRIKWDKSPIQPTTLIQHAPGWTIFDSLYVLGNSYYIVTDSPADFPDLREVLASEGDSAENAKVGNIQFIGTKQATSLFGHSASHVAGVTVMPGLWRTFSGLDPDISIGGNTYLPAPSRIIFPRLGSGQWRDHRKINSMMIRASFPSTSIETRQGWQERLSLDQAYTFDIVVLAQSAAASQSPTYNETHRALSNTLGLFAPRYWWAPVRNGVLEAAGLPRGQTGVIETNHKIIITYIVTQGRGLTLEYESHQKLSDELRDLERDYDWEVNIVLPDKMSLDEQLSLAARSTIIIGIHGRLFTNLLWMIPNKSSTIIELFLPGYFSAKYQTPAKALGIEHYGVWNDKYFRSDSEDRPHLREHPRLEDEKMDIDVDMIIELIQERILEPEKKSSMEVPSYLKEDDPVVDPPKLSGLRGAEPEEEEEEE